MNNKIIGGIVAVIILIAIGAWAWSVSNVPVEPASPAVVALAQCLRDKGATMYGAEWCPHCKNEKDRFGDAWQYVPYVECPDDPNLCLSKGVEGYPTWILADGSKRVGEQGLEGIAEAAGCPFAPEQ